MSSVWRTHILVLWPLHVISSITRLTYSILSWVPIPILSMCIDIILSLIWEDVHLEPIIIDSGFFIQRIFTPRMHLLHLLLRSLLQLLKPSLRHLLHFLVEKISVIFCNSEFNF